VSAQSVDPMNDATQWPALEPDGVTPSTELTIQDDTAITGHGADGVSARIAATAAAEGHLLRRTLSPALDVSEATQLRLSLRADRAAGAARAPFFLELRLGSAALPLSDPANTWHRLLPVIARHRWETVRLGIDGLDPAIAGALSQLQLRCVDADPPFVAHVDDLTAVRPQMIADADRALVARLDGIPVGGATAAAAVRLPSEALPSAPALDLVHFDVRFAPSRVRDIVAAQDFTSGGGLRLVPLGDPYDLSYAATPVAASRADQAELIEGVVDRLAPFDELQLDGDRLPVEMVWIDGPDRVGGAPVADPVLFLKVGARQAGGLPQAGQEVEDLRVEAEYLEAP
jgi:hypothetical protein